MSDQAFKADGGKLRMSLLPIRPMIEIAKVLEFGAKKYAPHAWRTGIAWTRILDAHDRHMAQWRQGNLVDEESGLNHLAHAACNLVFLLEFSETAQALNDLYYPGQSTRVLHDVIDGSAPCRCGVTHATK